jgi:hypothetical protein
MNLGSVGREKIEPIGKRSAAATVLKNIGTHVDCPIKPSSVKFRYRWGNLLVCDSFPGSKRDGGEFKNCC